MSYKRKQLFFILGAPAARRPVLPSTGPGRRGRVFLPLFIHLLHLLVGELRRFRQVQTRFSGNMKSQPYALPVAKDKTPICIVLGQIKRAGAMESQPGRACTLRLRCSCQAAFIVKQRGSNWRWMVCRSRSKPAPCSYWCSSLAVTMRFRGMQRSSSTISRRI